MALNRRDFLRLGCLSVFGLVVMPALNKILKIPWVWASSISGTRGYKRWAMVIDLGKCLSADGCSDCIDACHRIHNVPNFDNEKDEIKWIRTTPFQQGFPGLGHRYISENIINKPALMLCNHCDDPPCVAVCPTRATWKRWDGIVMMDYHRCIGCRYCIAACPYGSRSFNWYEPRPFIKEINPQFPTRTKGVVEKCNFCQERLEDGLIPACVEACNGRGLVFGDLEDPDSEVRKIIGSTFTIRRKPNLGTEPQIYYVV